MRNQKKKCSVCGFYRFGESVNKVNGKALWQVLKMYNVGGKLLNVIKSMYANSSAYIRVKGSESECFGIDKDVSCPCCCLI